MVKEWSREAQRGETAAFRLTYEQNLNAVEELCRGEGGEIRAVDHHTGLIHACPLHTNTGTCKREDCTNKSTYESTKT